MQVLWTVGCGQSLMSHERRHVIQYTGDCCTYTCRSTPTQFLHQQKLMRQHEAVCFLPAPINSDLPRLSKPVPCYQDREVQVNLVSIPPIQQLSHARRSTEDEETNTLSLTQQAYYSRESEVTSSCISSLPEQKQ